MDHENIHYETPIDQIALGIFNVLNSLDLDVIKDKEV
jgi:hypothetical protein